MKSALRAMRIGRVLLRYRLDDLLDDTPAERWLKLMRPFVPRAAPQHRRLSRGARLRLALQELGPIFVKFGQILSTRRDLVPPDIADGTHPAAGPRRAVRWRDRAQRWSNRRWAAASARPMRPSTPCRWRPPSIAQVHAATLHGGREVVVKVLRPDIDAQIAADIALLKSVAAHRRPHPSRRRQDPPARDRGRNRDHPGRRARPAARGRQRQRCCAATGAIRRTCTCRR